MAANYEKVLISNNGQVQLRIKRTPDFDEWQVVWIDRVNGNLQRNEEKTYYTDESDDAILTRKTMLRMYEKTGE